MLADAAHAARPAPGLIRVGGVHRRAPPRELEQPPAAIGRRRLELPRALVGDQQVRLVTTTERVALVEAVTTVGVAVAADHQRLQAPCPHLSRDVLRPALELPGV